MLEFEARRGTRVRNLLAIWSTTYLIVGGRLEADGYKKVEEFAQTTTVSSCVYLLFACKTLA